jgi:GT2 family glycosyltransferase
MSRFRYSIVVLTFNRNRLLARLLDDLQHSFADGAEIIVVDNCSTEPAATVTARYPQVRTIRAGENLGAAGRNLGFEVATGDIIICLDDDVYGLSPHAMSALDAVFADESVAAANFTVIEEGTGRVVNWVHHRLVEQFHDRTFDTYEITEGAVAFRRSAIARTGGYAPEFFLSHEGPDLAYRLMNSGLRVIYTPTLRVTHSFAPEGRASWRNFYYDTRNTLWLAARNLPFFYGLKIVSRQSLAMLVYSVRAGFLRWWFKGIIDGLRGLGAALRQRQRLTATTMSRIRAIDRFRPGLVYIVRRRLFQQDMRL